jgi:hypothetical protein
MTQFSDNTLTALVDRSGPVKVSFLGALEMKRVEDPDRVDENAIRVASMLDLLATKLKTIQERAVAKDYRDIVATLEAGLSLDRGLAAAAAIYGKRFNGALSLKAMTFFEDGDLHTLTPQVQSKLRRAATSVDLKSIPDMAALPGLSPEDVQA